MLVSKHEVLPVRSENDVVQVRQQVRKWAAELGFTLVDQTKTVTAASELARNVLVHGKGGTARLEAIEDGARRGIRLVFEDKGPGIPGTGLGLGLGGSKRLVTEFHVASRVGEGTCVTITKWK
jgi:serine/threonine-protein kinase RsbT